MHVRGTPIAFTFSIKTVMRGYHVYKDNIWNAAMDGTELPCKRDIGNAHGAKVKFLKDYLAE